MGSFTYDPNGNLTSDGTKTYEWDAENRLLAVKEGSTTLASFTYDGTGRRATKTAAGTTTSFVYDGSHFLEERPGAGTPKRYVYGPGIDRPLAQTVGGVTSYFVADHLGSIAQVTNSAGAPTLTRDYDPWGNPLQGSSTSGYAFTGREWESEASLYYYRARYYDAQMGRFISEDPSGLGGGVNLHAYVTNGPTTFTDPMGLQRQRPPVPAPGPDDDPFCYNRFSECKGDVEMRALGFAVACGVACVIFLRGTPAVLCVAACLGAAGIMQIRGTRECEDQYWECVTRHPQRRPRVSCL